MRIKDILNITGGGFWVNWLDDCGYFEDASEVPKELLKTEIVYITVDGNKELTIEVE